MVIDLIKYEQRVMTGMLQGMPYPAMVLTGDSSVADMVNEVADAYLGAQGIEDVERDLIFLDRERFKLQERVWQIELPKQRYGRFQLVAKDDSLTVHPMYGSSEKIHIDHFLEIGSYLAENNGIVPAVRNPAYFAKKEAF